jgi:ubiquinone/menaquinone biosynthesis C-methylase UbiE
MFARKNILNKVWNNIEITEINIEELRQEIQQNIVYISCNNKLFLSPLKNHFNNNIVLNIGSGYCFWSREILKNSEEKNIFLIVNLDIKEYYENNKYLMMFKHINLKTDSINFKDNTIHYVYQRDMLSVYNILEWENIIKEIHRVLKKDGYFELVEYDITINHTKIFNTIFSDIFFNYLKDIFKTNDYVYDIDIICNKTKKIFAETKYLKIQLPLYYEKKYQGMCSNNYILGLYHFKSQINNILKSKLNIDFDQGIKELENEWDKNESYMGLHIIYCKK